MKRYYVLLASILLVSISACQSEPRKIQSQETSPVVRPLTPGHLEGFVRLAGESIPAPTRVQNATDPAACGRIHTLENLVVSQRTRGIQGVIVALTDVPEAKIPRSAPDRLVLDNIDCRFSPHVGVLTVGSFIEARNSDSILHTTHLYGALETNIALPFKETAVTKVVDKPGMIIVKCDVHGWMQAYIRVDPHPFHAVTDPGGAFRLSNLPPGTYKIEAWHETLGAKQMIIHIREEQTERLEIEFRLNDK